MCTLTGSNTLAWVLGVIFGVLGGLLFAALLAWAIVAGMRKRRQKPENEEPDQQSKKPRRFFSVPGKLSTALQACDSAMDFT